LRESWSSDSSGQILLLLAGAHVFAKTCADDNPALVETTYRGHPRGQIVREVYENRSHRVGASVHIAGPD
jgi:hypothetical protein